MSKFKSKALLWLALVVAATLLLGCQTKPPPLSPAAASFKHEIKSCLTNLSAALMEPVAKKDVPAISAALAKVESPAVKLCRLCPFQVGVLNPSGEALALYPPRSLNGTKNFSNYDLVTKAIRSKKIQQQRFFLQNGSELYIICAPLVREDKVIGLIAVAVNSKDAENRWNFKEKEFLGLDFNS
ncbi:MAG: hypothetical protein ACYC6G_15100 [Desulfobaccales bacterium]